MSDKPEPCAWIIEPKGDGLPYMTCKADVAEKRAKRGDYVTPYISKRPTTDEEEL